MIEFPQLGLSFEINRTAFTIFGFQIYWYGILIACGFTAGILLAIRHARYVGMNGDAVFDLAFAGVIGSLIGARGYYVAFSGQDYTLSEAVFGIRDGGLAVYGGIIGALIFAFVYSRIKKCSFIPVLDLAAMGIPLGQAIGRLGNFFNQEAYGTVTDLPWGMTGTQIGVFPVHPCFLYESLCCLLICLVTTLFIRSGKRKFDGQAFLIYCFMYGAVRFMIEGLRTDSLYLGDFRVSQLVSAAAVIASVLITVIALAGGAKLTVDDSFLASLRVRREQKLAVRALEKNP